MAARRPDQPGWRTPGRTSTHRHSSRPLCEFLSAGVSISKQLSGYLKYTTCDLILLCQIYYYRYKRHRLSGRDGGEGQGERTPLIGSEGRPPHEEVLPGKILAIRYACALAFIVSVGVVASWVTNEDIDNDDANLHNPTEGTKKWWAIQVFGWSSALLFVRAQPRGRFLLCDSFPCPAGRPRAANMLELPRSAYAYTEP